MTDFFSSPVGMALLAGCCTWAFTAFGAGMVYTAKSFSRRTLDVMLGFAAGVMIAASYWSLLAPALEMSSHLGRLACVPVALGFLAGAGVLRLVDLILPHIHPTENVPDGPPSKLPRSALLVFAITLHNIPEGLAVGCAFGALASPGGAAWRSAWMLAIGIALQNFPEGAAVSLPLTQSGRTRGQSFAAGAASGLVEPLGAVLAFVLALAAGRWPVVEVLLRPYVLAIKAVPVASFIILALIWMRTSALPLFISFLMVFPILYTNVLAGLRSADGQLLEMARAFRGPWRRQLHSILLPAVEPFLLAGCAAALGMSWKAGVAAEVIGVVAGSLGERLYDAKIYLQTADLLAWTVVIVALSALFERLVLALLRRGFRRLERGCGT